MSTQISVSDLKPSPKDRQVKFFDAIGFVAWIAALVCAWQVGKWWGIGLVLALWVQSLAVEMAADLYRMEVWEGLGNLLQRYWHKLET